MNDLTFTLPKKAAAIHDLSCFGRCAQTVIIPVLSKLGVQTIPLPTALLSTHTGGYDGFTFLDLTKEMQKIYRHWLDMGIKFDAVYSGFLGSPEQINTVSEFASECKKTNPDCIFLADPVMGDDGEKYKTYTDEMCASLALLVKQADIITPNVTEACILTGTEYDENPDDKIVNVLIEKLRKITNADIVITGLHRIQDGKMTVGCAYLDGKESGQRFGEYVGANYPGTGDVFASILLAQRLCGNSIACGVEKAEEFIHLAANTTFALKTPVREGLAIESVMSHLNI